MDRVDKWMMEIAALAALSLGLLFYLDHRPQLDSIQTEQILVSVEKPLKYPYSLTPVEKSLQLEVKYLRESGLEGLVADAQAFGGIEEKGRRVLERADALATAVERKVAAEFSTQKAPYSAKQTVKILTIIADQMKAAGVTYRRGELYLTSINPDDNNLYLDCDLISGLICHIGRRLDMPIFMVEEIHHVYLFVAQGMSEHGLEGYAIESTAFNNPLKIGYFTTFAKKKPTEEKEFAAMAEDPLGFDRHNPYGIPLPEPLIMENIHCQVLSGLCRNLQDSFKQRRSEQQDVSDILSKTEVFMKILLPQVSVGGRIDYQLPLTRVYNALFVLHSDITGYSRSQRYSDQRLPRK
ncbi:hypothetical protein HZB02_00645 [Candidatus Woesearchaeota archaeon]|nr:hypothetical protein [Candidatus Woesearchaeota archaeon]